MVFPELAAARMSPGHQPVLVRELVGFLRPVPGARFLDCTFGGGGHARALLDAAEDVRVVALDRDPEAGRRALAFSEEFGERFTFLDKDFGRLGELTDTDFDGALFDFGVSSFQLDAAERGFSFRRDAAADMRLDFRVGVPASRWLETATEEMLVRAIRDFGEETHWRSIVRALLAARGSGRLSRTVSLAEVIAGALPVRLRHGSRIHPATRAFQGLRIAVNDELAAIERGLPEAFVRLRAGGVLCAISFHSLEDRLVKQYFRRLCGQPESAADATPKDLRPCTAEPLTGRPVEASEEERTANPRSRSAKLRAVRKL
ncbi:MAG TPA: 16S rRNA (cytosine(1402)-N(4))-methyltransferase RsmH [Opitutaceae bacterium]|jgi:16S rRNA (cytosine1402-N4)-methyltransferase